MNTESLLGRYTLGTIELNNRVVMSPMTRSRALGNIPNDLIAEYYGQRAGAGLIITEGTSPSPNGLGYSRIPGLFSDEQVEGWKKITNAVHSKRGKIFVQLMHTGRIGHKENLPVNAKVLAPSAVQPAGKMWTDAHGLQDHPLPSAMTLDEIKQAQQEFVNASLNAMKAGFDGIELHSANGYLIEQFLSPVSNIRTDQYGGSVENRSRFLLEVADATSNAIGKEKVGVRLSPYGVASDMPHYPEISETYNYLAEQLNELGILYIHIADHSAMGAPEVPLAIKQDIRTKFKGTIILAGGYTQTRAEEDIKNGLGDLIAFGRPFINNPDLVQRFAQGLPLSPQLDMTTFYTPDEKGYTDYPVYLN